MSDRSRGSGGTPLALTPASGGVDEVTGSRAISTNPKGKFHGLSSLHLSAPRDDWRFINNRLGDNWLRKIGQPAPCANDAMVTVNGACYGLYVEEGSVGAALLKQYFPADDAGDLFKGGTEADAGAAAGGGNPDGGTRG